MFSPLLYILRLLSASFSECVDGVNNLVKLEAPPDVLPVTFSSPVLAAYDGAGTPACYNSRGNIQLPGTVQLINGSFTVHKTGLVQFGKTKAMVTLVKNSFIVGSLCKDGKSTSMFLADSYCQPSVCDDTSIKICNLMNASGKYNLSDTDRILIPTIPAILKPFVSGEWKLEVSVQNGDGTRLLRIKMPADDGWFSVMQ